MHESAQPAARGVRLRPSGAVPGCTRGGRTDDEARPPTRKGSTMHAHLRRSAAALLLLLVAACAGNRRPGTPSDETASTRTTVRIENQGWSQAVIYIDHLSQRVRLGEVEAHSTRTFTIPPDVIGVGRNVRFIADPIGSNRTAQSFDLQVVQGDELHLTIPPTAF